VDEVYVKIKGKGRWLYRAVDKYGDTLDFLLSTKPDALVSEAILPQNPQPLNQQNAKRDQCTSGRQDTAPVHRATTAQVPQQRD